MAKNVEGSKRTNGKPVSKVNKPNTMKKAKYKDRISKHKGTSLLYKVILIAMLAVVFYPPFLRGLFFEAEYIRAELFVFIIFAAFWVYKILKKEKMVFSTPLDYASLGFVVVYLVSIIAAVGLDLAVGEWLKYCMYFAVFFILTDLAADFKNRIRVLWAITFSAVGVCILGIDAAAGGKIVILINNIFNKFYMMFGMDIPEKGTFFGLFVGGRINSTLQYPNTLAAYLMVAFFVVLALMLFSTPRFLRIIASCAGFIFFVTFVLALSRGAYLIFPFMLILFITVLPKKLRIKGAIYSVVPLIASVPVIIKTMGLMNSSTEGSTKVWLWVIMGIILCTILSFVSEFAISFFERLSRKILISFMGTIFVIICIGVAFILSVKEPITISFPENAELYSAYIMRSVKLIPDKEYRLSFNVVGENKQNSESYYAVNVYSKNEREIVTSRSNMISSTNGKATVKSVRNDIDFTVPADAKVLYLYFYNSTRGVDITFDKCLITDIETGNVAAKVALKYKYIPEMIVSRLQDIQTNQSSLVRSIFYKDGLRIFRDCWLTGAGGGAWSLLYTSYQSYSYPSTQAHNYYLQLAIESGVFGIIILSLLLFSIIFIYMRQRYLEKNNNNLAVLQAALFTILITLLLHAGIDFDFSFPAMLLLMWEILALFNAGIKETSAQTRRFYVLHLKELKLNSAFGVILSLVLIILSSTIISAISHFDSGARELKQGNVDLSIWHFQSAAELNPFKPEYKINYSNLVLQKGKSASAEEQNKANKWISEAEKLSKYDVSLLPFIVKYYFSTGKIKEGIEISEKMIELRPLKQEEWEQLIKAYNSVFLFYLKNNNSQQCMEMVNKGFDTISWAIRVNESNLDPFIFNAETCQTLERLVYYKNNGNTENTVPLDNIFFYSLPSMDIDGNEIPDQWNITSPKEFKLSNDNNRLKVEKVVPGEDSFIQSRLLNFKPNTKYRIEVTLADSNNLSSIRYSLVGVSTQVGAFESINGVNTAVVTTPEVLDLNYLRLYVSKSSIIKSISIVEVK